MLDDVTTRDIFEPIWIKAIKKKFGIDNNEFNVSLILKKGGKVEYAPKDMLSFLPAVAFIDVLVILQRKKQENQERSLQIFSTPY